MRMALTTMHAALAVAFLGATTVYAAPAANANQQACTACHQNISEMHKGSKHEKLACTTCHNGTDKHLQNPKQRPTVSMNPKDCGACHADQFTSMYKVNHHRIPRDSKKNLNNIAPNPFFDEALGAHGFVKEHNLPRAHAFGAVDQFIADRAFGGRFQPKDGWLFGMDNGGFFGVWDKIVDTIPENNIQKAHNPGTAAAANPVCWTCKSTDIMMDWAYLGDPKAGAKWSRASNPVDLVKNINHALNCNMCHDPHSAKPRVVRDALIQAMTRTDFPTLYSEDKNRTGIQVKDMGLRGFTRKIAILDKPDSKLMCAQCHVEYNCNPGTDPATGKPIKMDDVRTNLFPLVDITKLDEFYKHASFKDFKHNQTGALLTKMQHPDTEIYWNSTHDKLGIGCAACHMPKVKDKKTGKTYTSHWATTPSAYMQETCLQCHKDKTAEQMERGVKSMQQHFLGKLREAEGSMGQMFEAFREAKAAGVSPDIIKQAQELHSIAHTNWEWWTAANGAWFHNLPQAKISLAKSVEASKKATNLLRTEAAKLYPKPAAPAADAAKPAAK